MCSARSPLVRANVSIQLVDDAGSVIWALDGLELAALDAAPALQLRHRILQPLPQLPRGS